METARKAAVLGQLEQTALRAQASTAAGLAELAASVSAAVQELDETKQDKTNIAYVTQEMLDDAIYGAIARSY